MRRRDAEVQWPARLAVCVAQDWLEPGDSSGPLLRYVCWQRWVQARYDHLAALGYGPGDAQFEAVGEMPASIGEVA